MAKSILLTCICIYMQLKLTCICPNVYKNESFALLMQAFLLKFIFFFLIRSIFLKEDFFMISIIFIGFSSNIFKISRQIDDLVFRFLCNPPIFTQWIFLRFYDNYCLWILSLRAFLIQYLLAFSTFYYQYNMRRCSTTFLSVLQNQILLFRPKIVELDSWVSRKVLAGWKFIVWLFLHFTQYTHVC